MKKDLNSYIRTLSPKKNSIYQQVTSLLKKPKPLQIKNKLLTDLGESDEHRPYMKVLNELDKQMDKEISVLNENRNNKLKKSKIEVPKSLNFENRFTNNYDEHEDSFNMKASGMYKDILNTNISNNILSPSDYYETEKNKVEIYLPNEGNEDLRTQKATTSYKNEAQDTSPSFKNNIYNQIDEIITENAVLKNKLSTLIPIKQQFKNITEEIKFLNINTEINKQMTCLNDIFENIKNIKTTSKEDFGILKNLIEALKTFFSETIEMKFDLTKTLKEDLCELKIDNSFLKENEKILKSENETLKSENRSLSLNCDNKVIELKILKSENENLNCLIKKLPVLNLYEFQIKENIEKWFKNNQRTELINKFKHKIEALHKSCMSTLEILNIHIKLFEKQKNTEKELRETIEIQKNEIKNLKMFYEQKIQKLEKNGEEGIWSAFELSDL